MLPSNERLTRHQFPLLLANPSLLVVYNQLGTFKYITTEFRKYAVITSSKHEKKAVVRNKLRRRVYTLMGQAPFGGILYVSKQAYMMDFDQITILWHALLAKAHKTTK